MYFKLLQEPLPITNTSTNTLQTLPLLQVKHIVCSHCFQESMKIPPFLPLSRFHLRLLISNAHDPKSQYLDVYGTLICWINIWRPIIFLVVWQKDQQGRFVFLPCNLTEFHHRFSLSVPPWSLKYAPRQTTRHKQEDIFGAWLMPTGKLLKTIGEPVWSFEKETNVMSSSVFYCCLWPTWL